MLGRRNNFLKSAKKRRTILKVKKAGTKKSFRRLYGITTKQTKDKQSEKNKIRKRKRNDTIK